MITRCATNLRRDFFNIIKDVQNLGEPILIANRTGDNVILMTEDEYKTIMDTVDICSNPVEYEKVMHPDLSNAKRFKSIDDFERFIDSEDK
jgi:PHD/YefM family antitoxin component YafN of YafNO toxin-antitoxin module